MIVLFSLLMSALALDTGDKAPDFELKSTEGRSYSLSAFKGKVVVLEWFNPGCPFVKYVYKHDITKNLAKENSDVVWLAINSSAPKKQGHGVKANKKAKKKWSIPYPVLLDESGIVGKKYDAKTTPHMYIIDQNGILVYQGALDDSPFGKGKNPTPYVENALTALQAGTKIAPDQTKAYGCSVKYK